MSLKVLEDEMEKIEKTKFEKNMINKVTDNSNSLKGHPLIVSLAHIHFIFIIIIDEFILEKQIYL